MASPASPALPRTPSRRSAADDWPRHPAARWGVRAAFALPFVAVALLSRDSPWQPAANSALAARGDLVRWGDTDPSWMADVFPPLSAALSSLVGGSALALNLVAAVVLGFTLQRLAAVLVREGFGAWATGAVLGILVLTPPLYYLAANDLESLLGVALLVLALDGIASFVERRSTEAGFRAGLALGVAVMVDPGAWLYALTLGAVAPFFTRRAGRSGSGANTATVAVLLFPAVAALLFWLYISWWFADDPLGGMAHAAAGGWFPGGVGASAADAGRLVALALLSAPLVLIGSTVRAVRDPWTLIAPGIALAGLYLSLWLGLREAAGQTYVVLTAMYVLLIAPRAPSRRRQVLIVVAAAVQLAIGWAVVLTSGGVLGEWVRAVTGLG
ncbi:hypothetical protein [Cellulomonas sp. NPDC058312]|uniref:hypothetical protein n=1 Tax=Cellulomonas sp. NPDC058312 TaxID=3346441 RepID=UPI0036E2D27A